MTQKPWTRHYMDAWDNRAADHNLSQWLRVVCLAYGGHKANGHRTFGPGMLALSLGYPDPNTGEPVPEKNPGRAVRAAVKNGWLAEGSTVRCLVVPRHAISGPLGDPNAACPIHGKSL